MRFLTALLLLAGSLVVSASQQHEHQPPEKLGQVQFETSCSPGVAAPFNRAVALLHSFSFSTAREAFAQVAKQDPTCAMAHWGIAMATWGNPFAGLRADWVLTAGSAAVEHARSAGKPTPRERSYVEAVAELFKDAGKVDQRARVLAYEKAMERLHADHPADREGAIFYALAVNQTALPTDKTYAQQLKAAAILEKLWADQPQHPGLAHYIIHAYDHPPLAGRALEAARRYATIAPSAPHALHMPSHTFTRVGYWQESIDTNIASAQAALRDGAPAEALHAMDYQTYAYLQSGQDAAARRVADEAPKILAGLDVKALGGAAPPVAGQYAAAAMQARYALERGAWAEGAALEPLTTPFPHVEALTRFARALGAARSGSPEVARAEIVKLQALQQKLTAIQDTYWAGQVGIQHQVASAWLTFAENRRAEALQQLQAAVDAEDATDKSAISPGPLAPAREMYGEMLLALDRPADAVKAFEDTLKKEPNRFRATYLAAKAASLAGDKATAIRHYAALVEICKRGDAPGRPELAEARTVASR
jgi:tetratricopeptide (TPR) repeat protein